MNVIRIGIIAVAALVVAPLPAGAKDGDIKRSVNCSSGSTAKLKLSPEDGRIEVEFEVDQNRNGVRWKVRLNRNGKRVASTTATTRGPSGSFSVERRLADGAGSDRIVATAKSPSGEVCRVSATFR
jgi:hypothetical protein